jgi:hypothetical protein
MRTCLGVGADIAKISARFTSDSDAIFGVKTPTGIPVDETIERCAAVRKLGAAMNTPKRLFLGVISCFLLAAGLARAADRLDPMSGSLTALAKVGAAGLPTPDCTDPCLPCGEE